MIPSGAIYLVSGITDMRKSIDGLSLIVAETKSKFSFGIPMGFGFIIAD
ncbi:hypothetical protein [Vibrio scophthalmi]|uniref:Uncharacterized protein n=1 Tax=Vibrio scophthalmi LMG 19158 TaxID=870967 RepID=F9RR36_9VIBR|nr:hypothetical protein [Vibrio scophthalmi]EGU33622.1 hypothetical protein VIS19158_09982 [Vibrio scophthalmi LMG 19158]